jgi:hypothetical protein
MSHVVTTTRYHVNDMSGYGRLLQNTISIIHLADTCTTTSVIFVFSTSRLPSAVSSEARSLKKKKPPPALRMMAATNFAARYATGPILELPSGRGRGRSVPSHRRHRASLSSTRHKLARWRHGTLSMRISSDARRSVMVCTRIGVWVIRMSVVYVMRNGLFLCFSRFNAMLCTNRDFGEMASSESDVTTGFLYEMRGLDRHVFSSDVMSFEGYLDM